MPVLTWPAHSGSISSAGFASSLITPTAMSQRGARTFSKAGVALSENCVMTTFPRKD